MLTGVVYWAVWRILLPKLFGYTLVPRKQVLEDGTVVNVVCVRRYSGVRCEAYDVLIVVLAEED